MKLSTRSRYGTRAMLEIAKNYKNGPVKRKEITRKQGISPHYLENILTSLKSRNLLKTVRGVHGGFTLATSPENITMYEIITALEGSIAPVNCVEDAGQCSKAGLCIARKFWVDLHELQVKALKSANLKTLLDMDTSVQEIDFCI